MNETIKERKEQKQENQRKEQVRQRKEVGERMNWTNTRRKEGRKKGRQKIKE